MTSASPSSRKVRPISFRQTLPHLRLRTPVARHPSHSSALLRTRHSLHHPRRNLLATQSHNEMYEMMTSFVGMKTNQYLLLLDSSKFEKFTLPIDETVTGRLR